MKNKTSFTEWMRKMIRKSPGNRPSNRGNKPLSERLIRPHHVIMLMIPLLFLFACSLEEDSSDINLWINEVSASGEDWIEIYNPQSVTIDITGFLVYDGGHASDPYIFPNAQIPALGYLVLHFNANGELYNASFGLSSGGESVYLADTGGIIIDNALFPALGDGESYARVPDGSANWTIVNTPTPGMSNGGTPDLCLNEIFSNGDPDWIELYNSTSSDIDISGYFIYDDSSSEDKSTFPEGTVVPANGFLTWDCDDEQTSFKLSSGGEGLFFENDLEELIDSINFPALADSESFARIPDGGAWIITQNPTPGESNGE